MPRYRQNDYVLIDRKLPSGKNIWYYYAYVDGKKTKVKSTGIGYTRERDKSKSRREAAAYLDRLVGSGEIGKQESVTLSEYINRRKFWDWKRSDYIRGIMLRSAKDKPGITRQYVNNCRFATEKHILPYHGNKPIEEITPYDCEQLLFTWAETVTAGTANGWKAVYSTILGYYETELKKKNTKSDYFNPWRVVEPLQADMSAAGSLTIAEVKKIIDRSGIDFDDSRDRLFYYMTKIAFMSGLRIGEVCALQEGDIKDAHFDKDGNDVRISYLDVSRTWIAKLKTTGPVKGKDRRNIPIASDLRDDLEQFVTGNNEAFLFSFSRDKKTPVKDSALRYWYYQRIKSVGIDKEGRNIKFHSTRRFFNTLLRHAKVADNVIQRFTGHKSDKMTDHYTDYLPEDLPEIERAQLKLLNDDITEQV